MVDRIRDARWEGTIGAKLEIILEKFERLEDAIHGNGKEGLVVQTDRNTQDLRRMEKFMWVLIIATVSALMGAFL